MCWLDGTNKIKHQVQGSSVHSDFDTLSEVEHACRRAAVLTWMIASFGAKDGSLLFSASTFALTSARRELKARVCVRGGECNVREWREGDLL